MRCFLYRCRKFNWFLLPVELVRYAVHQVKTRMQLETGKSKTGLVGTLRNIIKEEGCVSQLEADLPTNRRIQYWTTL